MAQYYVVSDELYHHGILGMKWGVRRYQNADGSLTAAGKRRYGSAENLKEGRREDAQTYSKYERPGESAKVGLRRKHINKSIDRKLARSSKYDQELLSARSKNRERIQNSSNKKIEKAARKYSADYVDAVRAYSKAKIKDFNAGTRMVKDGQAHYNRVLNSYRDVKLSALDDKAFKKSPEYKQAVKDYTHQALINSMYGQSYTKLLYASDAGRRKAWDEKPSNVRPWDETPRKASDRYRNNI